MLEYDLKKYQELLLSLGVRDGVYDNLLNLKVRWKRFYHFLEKGSGH